MHKQVPIPVCAPAPILTVLWFSEVLCVTTTNHFKIALFAVLKILGSVFV